MHSIKFMALTVALAILFTAFSASAQQGDGSDTAPVVAGSALSVCLAAIEAERVRLTQPDATCDSDALARVRVACAGQETHAIQHFRHLMEMCGMEINGLDSLPRIFDAIDCSEPAGSAPTWQRRASCAPRQAVPHTTPHHATTRWEYVCVDGAYPVDRHGNATSGRAHHCACNEGLPFRVERRYARREMGHGSHAVIVGCAISHAGADLRGQDIEHIIERITRLETMCTDQEGHRQTEDEPRLCHTIWTLIESVAANQASLADLDRRVSDLEPRVAELERTAVDHEHRISALEASEANVPDVDLGRFRIGLGLRLPVRFETGVVSAYGVFTLEWAPRFSESFGLYTRANLGYGSYGDQPGQTGQVPLGASGLWGVAAGLELEPVTSFTLDLGVAFDSSLIEGQRGNAFGTYRWHNLGPELRARFNPHEHFFLETAIGATWSRTVAESNNNVLTDVDGFGLVVGAGLGASF